MHLATLLRGAACPIPDPRVSYYLRTLACDLTNSCDACILASVERSWNDKRRGHVNVAGSTIALFMTDLPIVLAPIAGRCPDCRTAGDVDLRAPDWRRVMAK